MPFILGANSPSDSVHSVSQSIRFNAVDTAYMTRTPSSAGNRRTWTFSCWLKRGNISSTHALFNSGADSSNNSRLQITSANVISYVHADSATVTDQFVTDMVLRDTAAWYHIVFTADTTNTIESERLRLYVNGQRITDLATTNYPTKDFDTDINNTEVHNIGRLHNNTQYLDGYLAEIVLLDGTSTDCNSFGEFNSSGIWIPKSLSGLTFGTNGFHIDGSDATGTPVKLGDDVAGSNNYTTSGMEANDQRADTPTNNQITFNPLNNQRSGGTPKNGNLEYHGPGTRTLISLTAAIPSTGKWVVAMTANSMSTAVWNFGVNLITNTNYGDAAGSNEDLGRPLGLHQYPYSGWFTNYFENSSSGTQISPSPSVTPTTSDEFWCAIDMATGKVFMGIYDADDSGSGIKWLAQDGGLDGNPTTGDNPTYTFSDFINNKDVTFGFASKNSSTTVTLLREADCTGTTPTDFTYFENVKDLIGS